MSDEPALTANGSACDVTADAMISRFYSRRSAGSLDPHTAKHPSFETLRQEFAAFGRQSRLLLSDPRLKLPEWAGLFAMAGDVLKVSKLLYAELRRDEAARSQRIDLAALDELLDFNRRQLDRLDGLLRGLDRIDGYVPSLQEALDEIQKAPQPLPSRLRNLARRMVLDVSATLPADLLALACGSQLRDYLARSTSPADPYVYASGIQTAQIGAWVAGREQHSAERPELITIAGLLQNCGLLCLAARYRSTSEALAVEEPTLYRRHPAIGAALASGLREYSLDLPDLIAGHHERLDGTGYPERLVGQRLSRRSRLLATVGRFVELLRDGYRPSERRIGWPAIADAVGQAGARLFRESEQGELDPECTHKLLASLDIESAHDERRDATTRQSGLPGGEFQGLRLDRAHQRVPSVEAKRTAATRQPLSGSGNVRKRGSSESPQSASPDERSASR